MSGQDETPGASWGQWMAAAQEGDAVAYERLLRALLPALRGFVASRLGDPSSVEDVVQNVLLSIHRARHTYRPERRFEPWFWTIARNAITDAQRSRALRWAREEPLADLEVASDAHLSLEPAQPLSLGLSSALRELPENQRQAVELLHVRQLSVAEAAARIGVTPGALKVRAHRGYRALRVILGERRD